MMLEIIDLLDDRQGSDPVYEERFAGSRWRWVAVSAASPFRYGPGQPGPLRIRTQEPGGRRPRRTARGAVRTRDLLALRLPAAGRRVPGRAGVGLRHRSLLPAAGHGRLRGSGLLRPVVRRPEDPVRRPRVPRRSRPRRGAQAARGSRLPAARPRASRVPRPGRPRLLPARLRGSRPPAAGVRASVRRPGDLAGDRRPGGSSRPGSAAYPEQWYDNPRPGNPHPGNRAPEHRGADDVRPARPADRRLEGMTYGELRYDDPGHDNPGHDNPGHDEPLDDESWYEELRRSAPAYPQSPGGPLGPGSAPLGPGSGPQRRPEPRGPASGPQPGHPQAPDRAAGYGQPRWDGSGPERPQLNAGRPAGRGQPGQLQPGPLQSAQLQPAQLQPGPAAHGSGFLSAPAAPVGLLTPPDGTRVDVLRDGGAFPAAPAAPPAASPLSRASHALTTPAASRPGTAAVRPGHGLDGPEITSSWPVQPPADLETFEDFWRDDADEEYTGLFGDREAEFERADAKQAAASKRRTGRRRSGSND